MTSTALVTTCKPPLLPTVDAQAPVHQQLSATRRIAEWHQAELETITEGKRGFGEGFLERFVGRPRPEIESAALSAAIAGYEAATGLTRAVHGRLLQDWSCIMRQRQALSPMAQHSLDAVVRDLSGQPCEARALALTEVANTVIDTAPVTASTIATLEQQLTRFPLAERLEAAKAVGEMLDGSGRAISDAVMGKLVDLSLPHNERLG